MFRTLILILLAAFGAFAQPSILALQNNYSNVGAGLPTYAIAQGSIFAIYGTNLSSATTGLQSVPLKTSLEGVSVSVTVAGTTRAVILYYVTPTQIAGILPSSTPVGTGTITVTNNGRSSAAAPIIVAQSAFGILTLDGSGGGAAAVFDARNQFLGAGNATHAGDVIVLYGTGAGPSAGDESLQQTQTNLGSVPILVEIGGRSAQVLYHGRTVFPGLDQINVVVPGGVSVGCYVTMTVSSGTFVSNFTYIPMAASGANCPAETTDNGTSVTQAEIDKWSAAGFYTTGSFGLTRSATYAITDNVGGGAPTTALIRSDVASAGYNRVSGNIGRLFTYTGFTPSAGSCVVISNFVNPFPDLVYKSLDAGTPLTVSGPAGARSIPRSINSVGAIGYSLEVGKGDPGNYLDSGRYTMSGPGGPDVGTFSGSIDVAPELIWTNRTPLATIPRSAPATVTWTGGEPTTLVFIQGSSTVVQGTKATSVSFQCYARNTDGQFTIPASVMLSLPPSGTQLIAPGIEFISRGSLALATTGKGTRVQATGLDYGTLGSQYGVAQSTVWK